MRKQDEYANPTSCFNRAHLNEFLFILRAKDLAAPFVIRRWVEKRIELGLNKSTDAQIQEALACAEDMEEQYELIHTGKLK